MVSQTEAFFGESTNARRNDAGHAMGRAALAAASGQALARSPRGLRMCRLNIYLNNFVVTHDSHPHNVGTPDICVVLQSAYNTECAIALFRDQLKRPSFGLLSQLPRAETRSSGSNLITTASGLPRSTTGTTPFPMRSYGDRITLQAEPCDWNGMFDLPHCFQLLN